MAEGTNQRPDPKFGQEVIDALRESRRKLKKVPNAVGTRVAMAMAIKFLDSRLTDAAKAGCHHCDDDIDHAGQPCHWCGLKATGRVVGNGKNWRVELDR